ncbi:MAG: hypothetical protein JF588_20750 [Caulobacterales bacterium]|nr:hypothetical protein [Caulobacterales bacterium]
MKALVGSLAADTGGIQSRADETASSIADLCLAAVAKSHSVLLSDRSF